MRNAISAIAQPTAGNSSSANSRGDSRIAPTVAQTLMRNAISEIAQLTAGNSSSANSRGDSRIALRAGEPFAQPTAANSSSSSPAESAAVDPSPNGNSDREDIEERIWNIEHSRNEEFRKHLGVIAKLSDRQIFFSNFQEILKSLAGETNKRSAIIYVVSRSKHLELILVPPYGDPIRRLVPEAPPEILFPVVEQFRAEVTSPRKLRSTSYLQPSQKLYQWILAPLEADLEKLGIETLLLSMDPGLRSLPVAALHDGEQFLIEKYSFSLIPSFSLTPHQYQSIKNAEVLAMGASKFSNQMPLPAVPVELEAIAAKLSKGQFFLNEAFTVENLIAQRQQKRYQIVHLATHAEFRSGTPEKSYIQLWNDRLSLDEMPDLNWNNPPVDLLVLSACRTALGDEEAELGFAGLAVQSGVRTALASLWYVSDTGTLGVMAEFYRQIRQSPIKAEALRQAQLAMLRGEVRIENGNLIGSRSAVPLPNTVSPIVDTDFSHPYYWSGFTAIGSPW